MLEVFAFWARLTEAGATRHEFHAWLVGHYADSVQALRPELSADAVPRDRVAGPDAHLGAWLTLGARGRTCSTAPRAR